MRSFFSAVALVWTILLALENSAQAQSHCATYANEMVGLHARAHQERIMQCPGWRSNANWQGHFNWCSKQPAASAKMAAETASARFDGCVSSYGKQGGGVAAPAANTLRSGRYTMKAATHPANVIITVTGNRFTGRSEWLCCPGSRVDPLIDGKIVGNKISFVRVCTGQGYLGPCRQTFTGTISGNSASGVSKGTGVGNNPGVPWSMRYSP